MFDVITEWSSNKAGIITTAYLIAFPELKNLSEWEILVSNRTICRTIRDALEVLLKELQGVHTERNGMISGPDIMR